MADYASFEVIRTIAFGGISGTYAPVGAAFANPIKLICFTNNTDGDMFFSDDGVNNKMFIPKGSFKLFDITTNKSPFDDNFVLRQNLQFYVKQSTAATAGAVYIECIY